MKNEKLIERFLIEQKKRDRSGVYAYTQRTLAYNSNKIEGSALNEEQTASLFERGTLPATNDYYRAKDIEETNGHFLMFNRMLETLSEPLSEKLIKDFHYQLKSGVFEDRANGYAIGDYKQRANMIGMYKTVLPGEVGQYMKDLLQWYQDSEKNLKTLAEFHARYECIHPFQDGNGRTGRMILFRECLKADLAPVVILEQHREKYINGLREYHEKCSVSMLLDLFAEEQQIYQERIAYFFM